jgi:hypothetical protein
METAGANNYATRQITTLHYSPEDGPREVDMSTWVDVTEL